MPTRIKICGITSRDDAVAAAEAGADAIGLVFYEHSPRAVTMDAARDIALSVGPFVTVVGLFVNAGENTVNDVLRNVPLQVLQFHGDEDPDYCRQFHRPFVKAIRVKPEDSEDSVSASILPFAGAGAVLLDTYSKAAAGGTGETFNWKSVPQQVDTAIVVAGGLNPENVAQAVRITQPYAVDVSSGVEAEPGKKSAEKIKQFIHRVHTAFQ